MKESGEWMVVLLTLQHRQKFKKIEIDNKKGYIQSMCSLSINIVEVIRNGFSNRI